MGFIEIKNTGIREARCYEYNRRNQAVNRHK